MRQPNESDKLLGNQLNPNSYQQAHSKSNSKSRSNDDEFETPTNIGRKPPIRLSNSNYLAKSSFETVYSDMIRQNALKKQATRSRSPSNDLTDEMETHGRKALYGTLPFIAASGMQKRENSVRKAISAVSLNTLASLELNSNTNLDDIDVDKMILTIPLVMAVLVAMTAQFLVGFNTSVMNSPANVVFPGHTTAEWSLAVSAFAIGGPGGAILGGHLANQNGRRGAMLINTWIFLIGGVIMSFAQSVMWLIPARLIIGFASGLASVVVPVYLGEIAPPTLRGTLGTLTQFSIVIGILVSDIVAIPLSTESRWRYLFGITPMICILQILASPFLLESPRWYLGKDKFSIPARKVIKKLRGFRHDYDVEQEVQYFLFAASQHKTDHNSAHSSGAMLDLIKSKELRLLVVSAIVLQISQQLSGINAVFYYSTSFFEGTISNPAFGTILVAFINVVATYIALTLMDSTGRRTLILWSAGGMIISSLCIVAALLGYFPNYIALLAVMFYVSFFEIGLGPIPWLIVAEMFDSKYVATAMSMACIVNWGCNFLVGLLFPYMQEYLGPYSFGPFCAVLIGTFFYTYFYLPETLGKSIEEIYRMVLISTKDDYDHNNINNNGNNSDYRREAMEEEMTIPIIEA
eukprot:gene13518-18136_t